LLFFLTLMRRFDSIYFGKYWKEKMKQKEIEEVYGHRSDVK
jgi:hypothetical protein